MTLVLNISDPKENIRLERLVRLISSPLTVAGTHQVGGEQGLEMQQKTSRGDLLQPAATGFLTFTLNAESLI